MSADRGTLEPRFRHSVYDARDGTDTSANGDNNNFSLILRPADFDDEPHDASRPDTLLDPALSSSRMSRSQSVSNQPRSSAKRREHSEHPSESFMHDSQIHTGALDEQTRLRQDVYSTFDDGGRRIGLDHPQSVAESNGYYRKHVHEYDNTRGGPLHLPSQMPAQSKYPEQGPLPPVSAVIAGIPPDPHYGVSSFSHIQNRPRTPHEILGLPAGAPLNLWSLADPDAPDAKPQYNYHVLVKLAILGNKGQKATLQDILRAIRMRFPYYANLPKQEAIAFSNSIRHLLSLLAAFVREPKPVTEPGKGSYWKVDFSKGEGNKRVRKRNKPQKKTADGQPGASKQDARGSNEKPDNGSETEDSQLCASTETPIDSPISASPVENPPQTPKPRGWGKGGRKPAPKNLVNTPNGGTATVSTSLSRTRDNFDERPDPMFVDNMMRDPGTVSHSSSAPDLYMQAHSGNIGAHRGRVVRGAVRNSPYPPTVVTSRSASVSSSSERDYQQVSMSPVDMRYQNGHYPGVQPVNRRTPSLHEQQERHSPQLAHGAAAYANHGSSAYTRQYTLNNNEGYDSVSSQSPMSDQSILSPIANTQSHLPIINSSSQQQQAHHPNHFIRNDSTASPASATYGNHNLAYPDYSSNAGTTSNSIPGNSSTSAPAMSNTVSYGFMPYVNGTRQNASTSNPTNLTMRIQGRHGDSPQYANFVAWNPPRSQAEITGHRH